MGQYFYFKHQYGTINKKPLPWNFGLPWMKSLEKLGEQQQLKIFKHVMELNNWLKGDVFAIGDYGYTIIYDSESDTLSSEFNPEDDE
jgi:hypothetical protein